MTHAHCTIEEAQPSTLSVPAYRNVDLAVSAYCTTLYWYGVLVLVCFADGAAPEAAQ